MRIKSEVKSHFAAILPKNMETLPVDRRGFPVPWFVFFDDSGEPDFRVLRERGREIAIKKRLCWICGKVLGRTLVFVSGPMCGISGVSAEPPSHWECARFSALACPFLTLPKAVRREAGLPDGTAAIAGKVNMIMRNPGVAMLWYTHSYQILMTGNDFVVLMGEPIKIEWYAEGRLAFRSEVEESVRTGLPILMDPGTNPAVEDPRERERLKVQLDFLTTTFPQS